jgi:hypothetical protein
VLLLLFALGITVGTGVTAALNASVFSASAAAFALSTWPVYIRERGCTAQGTIATGVVMRSDGIEREHFPEPVDRLERSLLMSAQDNVAMMLEIFRAIERRDLQRMLDLCHADVEFQWPPALGERPAG